MLGLGASKSDRKYNNGKEEDRRKNNAFILKKKKSYNKTKYKHNK